MYELSVSPSETSGRTKICVEKDVPNAGIRILVAQDGNPPVDFTLTAKGTRELIDALIEALLA